MLHRKNKSAFGCISTKDNNWKKENHMPSGDTSNGDNADVVSTGDSGGRDDADGNDNRNVSAIREYSQAASVHGLKYVWAGNRSLFSRIIWAFFFMGMLSALSVTLFRNVNEMRTYPTLTKQTVVMEEELLFPAVTICNHNQFRRSVVENNTLLQQLLAQMSGFGYIFEPINFTDPVWIKANKESSPEEVAKLLEHAPHPLNTTLVRCHWRNEEYRCVDLFKTVMTDFGVCYAFNTHVTETEQRTSDLFGNMYGLSVIMNTNQPEYVLSQWNVASGFRVLLHGFWQTPQVIEKGFSVGPGSSYFGKISAQKISFLPAPFKAFGDKACIESNEGQMDGYLRYFQTYDPGACSLECQMNFSYEACGCRGVYDPVVHLPVCSPQNLLECYLPKSKEFRENKTLRNSCVCPMACKLQSYGVSLSMASYPSQIFMKKYNSVLQPKNRLTEKFYRANYVELHLYYDNAQIVNIDQFPKYTFESIMSSLGGQMGVFLGASLISLVEFVDFIVGAIMAKLKTARNKVGKQKTVDTIPTKD